MCYVYEIFHHFVSFQIKPPWKPDVDSQTDTKYIPEEFLHEPVELTPPQHELASIDEDDELPYFEQFSYHGSRSSLNSFLSTSGASNANTLYWVRLG